MSNTSRRYLSPVPGLGLEGYADEMTVSGGGKIRFMVGGPKGTADVKMVRLIHGDPNADGPGYREEEVFWGQPETVEVRKQDIDFGSYVEVPHSDVLNPKGGFTWPSGFIPRCWVADGIPWRRSGRPGIWVTRFTLQGIGF